MEKNTVSKRAAVKDPDTRKAASNRALYKKIGLCLAAVQLVCTVVFSIALLQLAMLPTAYFGVIVSGLFIVLVVITLIQLKAKRGFISKFISIFTSIILIILSFYLLKTSGALASISNTDSVKIDKIVVAVLEDDPAEELKDVADYKFGVQYSLKGDEIKTAMTSIEKELGTTLDTKEYDSMLEQLTALHDEKVQAVIFDEALLDVMAEELGEAGTGIKIIYSYEIKTEVEPEPEKKEIDVTKDSFIVYISGIDVYGSINKTSRSDVNILAVVNPTDHKVLLVTTPRDYFVPFPGVTDGQRDKLTHAGIYGVDVSMATLDQLYDIETSYYARVNFTSLINVVDALGGITVYSEQAFTAAHSTDGSVYHFKKGENHLNGKEALAFCRERHNLADGDNQRGKNQEAVLKAIIEKLLSPAILKGASDILSSVEGNVETNLSEQEIQKLIQSQLKNPASWDIQMVAATGTGAKEYCYSMPGQKVYVAWPNEDSVNEIKETINAVME